MRALQFQQIADSRFTNNTLVEVNSLKAETVAALSKLTGLSVAVSIPVCSIWPDGDTQHRITFTITKRNGKGYATWRDVIMAVNSVKAVPFDFIKTNRETYENL